MLPTPYTQRTALALQAAARYRQSRAYHLNRAKTLDGWQRAESIKSADRATCIATEQLIACRQTNTQARHYTKADSLLRAAEQAASVGQDIIAAGLRYKAERLFSLAGI